MRLIWIAALVAVSGTWSVIYAVYNERRMQRHRQPGVTYAQVTLRRDGGWRRTELFTPQGLEFQRRAARYGAIGVGLWILAGITYMIFALTT